MQFYSWKRAYINHTWKNHVFSERGASTSLCNEIAYGLGGDTRGGSKCLTCKKLAPIKEEKAQVKERARVAKQELKRPAILEKINSILNKKSMDGLLNTLRRLKQSS